MLYVNTLGSRLKVITIACFKKDGNLLKVVLELEAATSKDQSQHNNSLC